MPSPTNLLRLHPAPYTSGRGLFLTQKVQPGQLVLHVSSPLVAVPDDRHLGSCCSWCLKWDAREEEVEKVQEGEEEKYPDPGIENIDAGGEGEGGEVQLVRCSGCRVVWYCGKECQKYDFTPRRGGGIHKLECPIYSTLNAPPPHSRVLPTSVRVLIKLLLLHNSNDSGNGNSNNNNKQPLPWWSSLLQLESHATQQLSHPQRSEMLPVMAAAAQHYSSSSSSSSSTLPSELILSIYCRTLVNSFSITTPTTPVEILGTLFDPLLSLFNHSCTPSCLLEFRGREVLVYALREISEGEEATIAYVDVESAGVGERRRELKERWFFDCMCGRCKMEMEMEMEMGEV